jgi:subtilase family serine protease
VNIFLDVDGEPAIEVYGGTSLATPTFSALWAIANQAAGSKAPLGQAAAMLYSLPAGAITDVKPVSNGWDVRGEITNPPQPVQVESAADLAQPLENTTTFLSALYHGSSTRWYDLTFGTDTSLLTAPGWDDVTGLGTPNGFDFVKAVVAAAP